MRLAWTKGTCWRAMISRSVSSSVLIAQRFASSARPASVRLSTPASTAKQLEQRRLPQVDPGLHAECETALDKRLEQRRLRQEDLVDEIEIARALRDQPVDLFEKRLEIAPPVAVAIGKLGAERARIGAAARSFHLPAWALGLPLEAMVMMGVAAHP